VAPKGAAQKLWRQTTDRACGTSKDQPNKGKAMAAVEGDGAQPKRTPGVCRGQIEDGQPDTGARQPGPRGSVQLVRSGSTPSGPRYLRLFGGFVPRAVRRKVT